MSIDQLIHSLKTENQFNNKMFQCLQIEDDEDIDKVTLVALQCTSDDVFMSMIERNWIIIDMFLIEEVLHFQRYSLLERILGHKSCQYEVSIDDIRSAAIKGNIKELETLMPFYKYKSGDYIDSDWCGISYDYENKQNVHICINYLMNHSDKIKWYNKHNLLNNNSANN